MKCSRCKSENVSVQAVTTTKNKKHGLMYWLFIGWWLEPTMWIFLTIPWLIIKIFKPNKVSSKTHSEAVCQSCGNRWKI